MRTIGFDLETHDADRLYTHSRDGSYLRLAGVVDESGTPRITTDPAELLDELTRCDVIYGHNIMRFDLPVLAHHCGASYASLAAKAVDTVVLARLADPPGSRGQRPWGQAGYYGLDALAKRFGLPGKRENLKELSKEFGGLGSIPQTDERFRAYLVGDLAATYGVYGQLAPRLDTYARRELKIAALQNLMSVSGWRIDETLLARRIAAEEGLRAHAVASLAELTGMPTTGKAPWTSNAGRQALVETFERLGVWDYPTTETGKLALSSAALGAGSYQIGKGRDRRTHEGLLRRHGQRAGVQKLAELLTIATGGSAKYAEIAKYLANGRVHGGIGEDQASGRWAMTRPSLTNLGKRGPKVAQRAVFLPDEGHVLICADLDQVDMRALAGLSGDPNYRALFAPGLDAHAEIAELVFGDRSRREEAKPIGHGWNYGRSVRAISEATGIPITTVSQFDRAMKERFPRLCGWRDWVREKAASGEMLNNGFGRLMRCTPERAYTQAPALMGQGAARDLMCDGLLRLPPDVQSMLRAVVHDEIVLSVPVELADEVSVAVKQALTFEWKDVPITAGVSKPGSNWAACYAK